MKNNRLAVVTLCLVAAVGPVAGCQKDNATGGSPPVATSSAPAPSPSVPSPKDALLGSAKAMEEATFEFLVNETAQTAKGKMDPLNQAALMTLTAKEAGATLTMDVTLIDNDLWIKIDMGAALNKQFGINKTKWMSIDPAKLTNKDALPSETTAGSIASDLLGGLVTAERVDDTSFKGTVDLTKMELFGLDEEVLTKVGDKAKAVPFTATVDTKGRLTQVKTDGTGIDPALTIDMTFTNFGGAVSITKPAGAVPAPASLYTLLNAS